MWYVLTIMAMIKVTTNMEPENYNKYIQSGDYKVVDLIRLGIQVLDYKENNVFHRDPYQQIAKMEKVIKELANSRHILKERLKDE